MKDELLTLAGKSHHVLKNLKWKHLIEFAETFGVGVDELDKLPAADRFKAVAWLYWSATGRTVSFDEFLNEGLPDDLFPA